MAPETQFSAGKIIDAAIGITRAHGIDAVTARSIAKQRTWLLGKTDLHGV